MSKTFAPFIHPTLTVFLTVLLQAFSIIRSKCDILDYSWQEIFE